jgi:endonuclease/exonuclease/phosphatase family metal-dependent hydrolase
MRARATLAAAAVFCAGLFVLHACSTTGKEGTSRSFPAHPEWPQSMDTISVITWNLGYSGLGRGSDFFADGGRSWLPPGPGTTRESAGAIAAWLGESDADIILTQENARASVVNYWTDLKGRTDRALAGYQRLFHADFRTRYLPPPLRISNGMATYARHGLVQSEIWPMPSDGDPYDGLIRRRYGALATYVEGPGGCWVFVNVHTSAFDEGGALRKRQVATLLERAVAAHALGYRVVMGGDFNLRLVATQFPHTTEDEYLGWIHDFDPEVLPEGWRVVADGATPSVRTNERAYQPGENYTTVIDGFVVSPGVDVMSVAGVELGFRHSDHQPVRARFKAGEGLPQARCEG